MTTKTTQLPKCCTKRDGVHNQEIVCTTLLWRQRERDVILELISEFGKILQCPSQKLWYYANRTYIYIKQSVEEGCTW